MSRVKVVLARETQLFIPTYSLTPFLTHLLLPGDQDAKVTLRRLSDALGKVLVVLVYHHHHHHHHHHRHHHQGALRAGWHLRHRRPPTERIARGGGLTLTLTRTRTRTLALTLTVTPTLTLTCRR